MDVTWDFQPPNSQFYFTTSQLWNSVDTTILSGHFLTILLLVQGRLYIRKNLFQEMSTALPLLFQQIPHTESLLSEFRNPRRLWRIFEYQGNPCLPQPGGCGVQIIGVWGLFSLLLLHLSKPCFCGRLYSSTIYFVLWKANWAATGDSSLYSYLSFGCWGHVLPVETPRDERRRGPVVPPCQRVSRLASHLPVAKHVSVQDWKPPHKIIVQPGAGVQEVVLVLVPRVEVVVRRKLSPPRCFAHLPVIRIKV